MYRDLFELCSSNGDTVHKDVYKHLLSACKLDNSTINTIIDISCVNQGALINRTTFYKTLALIAWCQQGKSPSDKLFDNFSGKGQL